MFPLFGSTVYPSMRWVPGWFTPSKSLRKAVISFASATRRCFVESFFPKPVLNALVQMRKLGMWTEIVYLVVPTLNDGEREFTGMARWVKTNLGPDVPLHFSRFHPEYLLKNLPVTPVGTLDRAHAIAVAEGLNYVYVGNVPGHAAENTYCPKCRRAVVERTGFTVRATHLSKGKCKYCRQPIAGVWEG